MAMVISANQLYLSEEHADKLIIRRAGKVLRTVPIIVCCLIISAVMSGNALAYNRWVIMPGVLFFDYVERNDDDIFLDGETGPVPGVSAQIEFLGKSGISWILQGGVYSGEVDYDGHASPTLEPAKSDTKTNFFNLGGVALFPLDGAPVKSNVSLGYQFKRWERNIQPTVVPSGPVSGLYEVYEWEELSLGIEFHLKDVYSQQWSFYAGVFHTQNPHIEINLVSRGEGKPKLNMGSDTGMEFSAQWAGKTNSGWFTGWKVTYKTWRFDKSNSETVPTGRTITEPASLTKILMLELVLSTKN